MEITRKTGRQEVDGTASRQWFSRPDDERYLNLESLREAVADRTAHLHIVAKPVTEVNVSHRRKGDDFEMVFNVERGEWEMTHWSFSQVCSIARTPADFMRTTHPVLAEKCMNYGLLTGRDSHSLQLNHKNGQLRAMTSTKYGMIRDLDVVDAVMSMNAAQGGVWVVPPTSFKQEDLSATTLYASDRDVFIFLVDPKRSIQVGDTNLFRGFYVWNSEVGARTFGISSFKYERVCGNRNIWGVHDQITMKFKHSSLAPDRFYSEVQPALNEYALSSAERDEAQLRKAKALPLGKTDDDVMEWITTRGGFGKREALAVRNTALDEYGQCETLWDLIWGATAYARKFPHTDARVNFEERAGALMDRYAGV
jgi:hypothetical protein